MTDRLLPLRKATSERGGNLVVIPSEVISAAEANVGRLPLTADTGSVWMGPGLPPNIAVTPQPQERKLDYPVNYNTRFQPRSGEGVSFGQLRLFAEAYDLLRVVIERRKDQVVAYEWSIGPRKGKEEAVSEEDIEAVTAFFQQPSTEYSWDEWIRALLEDLLVLDAVAIAPRTTYGDALYSLDLIDAATIKRVIDERGMTPLPPDPAYQQILKGIPAVDFTVEDLYYWIRNPRTWKTYGFGPVEWILVTVNIALNRQAFTLNYFSEGNIPEALATVPATWTTRQIAEFQTYWDELMTGNLANRRRMRFIPMDASKVKELKAVDLKNEFDEWLARLICFAFSISPSSLIKDMNRATADTNKEIATEDGLLPLLNWLKQKLTRVIHLMGFKDLEFKWEMGESLDALQQSTINGVYIDKKVLTPDEVREQLGRKPLTPEQREAAWPAPPPMMMGPDGLPAAAGGEKEEGAAPQPKEEEDEEVAPAKAMKAVGKMLMRRAVGARY